MNSSLRHTLHILRVFRDKFAFYTFSILFRVNHKKIVFSSFLGKSYSDNPRAISEKLHELHPEFKIIWLFQNTNKEKKVVPAYIKCVKSGSLSALFHQTTAGFWVDNYCKPFYTKKRKTQIYIQTWHGDRGLKKVLHDAYENCSNLFERDHCDLAISGSKFGEKVYKSSFLYNGEILKYGCPRNDLLVNGSTEKSENLRKSYHVPSDCKVLLYAPTFRDSNKSTSQNVEGLDFDTILSALESKTNEKWCLFMRGHTGRHIETDKIYKHRYIDVTDYEDAKDVLLASDAVISDYSTVATDYAILGRPIFLYVFDIQEYESSSRSLWYKMENTPFWYAQNQNELIELISQISTERVRQNCKAILDFYGAYETGAASEKVCEYIVNTRNKYK